MVLTIRDTECVFTTGITTELLDFTIQSDTITFKGFDKEIYYRTYKFSLPQKKELVLQESFKSINDSLIKRTHYLRRSNKYPQKDEEIFVVKDAQPEYPKFPGGNESMKNFIKSNLKIIPALDTLNYLPVIKALLTLNEEGKIINAEITNNLNIDIYNEAMRLIQLMPDWIMEPKSNIINKSSHKTLYTYFPIQFIMSNK